ncbi:MAG: hypothetical protein FJ206_07645 [Gemmatimonadetes bacterium]|nr:hypothetical protein [Gemmatimonadota bacterium]
MNWLWLGVVAVLAPFSLAAQQPTHPLDGLTAAEHWVIYDVLQAAGKTDSSTLYVYEGLHEPPKAEVLAWRPGAAFRREAMVQVVQREIGYEGVIDLIGRKLLSWREATKRQYMVTRSEGRAAGDATVAHPEVRAALRRRGITDFRMIYCSAANEGYLDTPEERGRRLARMLCFNTRGAVSGVGAPIDGLQVVVDLQTAKVVRVTDTGVLPAATLSGEHHPEAIGPTRAPLPPLGVSQPMGPGFKLDGTQVSWDNWRFHFRLDPRRGLVLSQIRTVDQGRERSVLYQASLSELLVLYMDPEEPWNYQAYFDLGAYPAQFGGVASPLEPGSECPSNAVYFSSFIVSEAGSPFEEPRTACLFERLTGDPLWRHARPGITEARAQRDLVLRMIMGAGNYDYLFDWIFSQDGSIHVEMAATGIDQVRGARTRTAADSAPGGPSDRYGRFVAPYLVAVNHSHFFAFRLDFDVDGQANSLEVDRLVTERQPATNPRRSVWAVRSSVPTTEQAAKRHSSMSAPEFWRVINPSVPGPYGGSVGYTLEGHGVMTLLSDDDYMRKRAGFSDYTLWATPHSPTELYAAGDYPTVGPAGQGLPDWTKANRPIANTDIVLWYTIGFHHVPRPEDWPILSLERHHFEIKPSNFFARNPGIDLPRQP